MGVERCIEEEGTAFLVQWPISLTGDGRVPRGRAALSQGGRARFSWKGRSLSGGAGAFLVEGSVSPMGDGRVPS